MPRLYGDAIALAHPTKLLTVWLNRLYRAGDVFTLTMGSGTGELDLTMDQGDLENLKAAFDILTQYKRIRYVDLPTAAKVIPPATQNPLDFA